MKRILLTYMLLGCIFGLAQSTNQNWVKTTDYLTSTSNADSTKITVQYFDGLGRANQVIAHKQSPEQKDIIVHIGYDEFGRQTKEYLPFAPNRSSLNFEGNAGIGTQNYYQTHYGTDIAYSEKELEASPLNRVLKQAAPGEDWTLGSGHEIKFDYQANSNADNVKKFTANTNYSSTYKIYNISLNRHQGSSYANGLLYKTITRGENHTSGKLHTIEEFKNKEGQVVLKRTYALINNQVKEHDTYYVYDMFGNLTYVLPPLVNHNVPISSSVLNNLCYQYRYDDKNRLVEKKLPGKGWEYMVYDKQNRLVATQDQNMRSTNATVNPFGLTTKVWLFTKYDKFWRVVYTGYYKDNDNTTRKNIQDLVNARGSNNEQRGPNFTASGISIDYSKNGAFPYNNSNATILTVNYYDNYDFPENITAPSTVYGKAVINPNSTSDRHYVTTKSLPTASFVRVLDGNNSWEKTFTFYDTKSRPIRIHKSNHLGGRTIVDSKLDFRGKLLETKTRHKRLNQNREVEIIEKFTYDHAERIKKHTHKLDDEPTRLLANNTYDALGQLKDKKVGGLDISGNNALQKVDYKYNIRGWLTDINNIDDLTISGDPADLFSFHINYNALESPNGNLGQIKKLYNGNISEAFWRTSTDNVVRGYGYSYDALNRLKKGFYKKNHQYRYNFDEWLKYDKNGNILELKRWGTSEDAEISYINPDIDFLKYTYYPNSNKLRKVEDETISSQGFRDGANSSNEYVYDANGNMIKDLNKKIGTSTSRGITYNHLNLPTKIKFENRESKKIEYIYNAAGVKVQKKVTNGTNITTTDYLDGFQYKNNRLQFFSHAEGYVNVLNKETQNNSFRHWYDYVYHYTDHLGNIRMSYTDANRDGVIVEYTEQYCINTDLFNNCTQYGTRVVKEVLEENHYYPFGLKHEKYNSGIRKYQKSLVDSRRKPVEVTSSQLNYKYKYQGQERQDELGLNWDSFKYRNYDYAIGRFMSIDPLAEDYSYQSPYNFSENRVVDGIELEGLEHLDGKIVHQFKYNTLVDGKNIYSTRGASETGVDNIYSRTSTELNNNTVYNDTTVSVNEDGVISSVTTTTWDSSGNVNYTDTITEPGKVENAVSNLGNIELENGQTLEGYVQDVAGYKVSNGESPIQTTANTNFNNQETAIITNDTAATISTIGGTLILYGVETGKIPSNGTTQLVGAGLTTLGAAALVSSTASKVETDPEKITVTNDILE